MEGNIPQQEHVTTLEMRRLSQVWFGPGIMYFGKQSSGGGLCDLSDIDKCIMERSSLFFFFPEISGSAVLLQPLLQNMEEFGAETGGLEENF